MRRYIVFAGAAAVAMLASAPAARAQDDAIDRTPRDCIPVSRIRNTRVVDGRTVLFYMRNRAVYRNDLPRECPRLAQEDRFMYEARSSNLCDIDWITVLESFGGRLERGASCQLGPFVPVTRAEANDIVAGPEGARRQEDVAVEEVELPPEQDEAETDAPEPGD